MNRKQFLLALAIVAVFSFLGGIVGGAISGGGIIMAAKGFNDNSTFGNPTEIKYLKAEQIEVGIIKVPVIFNDGIFTKDMTLWNESEQIVGRFGQSATGDPLFGLYSSQRKENKPAVLVAIENGEPRMQFLDKDLDTRIWIGVDKLKPSIDFFYRNKKKINFRYK